MSQEYNEDKEQSTSSSGRGSSNSRNHSDDGHRDNPGSSSSCKNDAIVKAKLPKQRIIRALKPLLNSMIRSSGIGSMRAESDLESAIVFQASAILDIKSKQEELLIRLLDNSMKIKEIKEQRLEVQKRMTSSQKH